MLLRSSNRLPMELPDLFLMPLEKEGLKGEVTCMVAQMDNGTSSFTNQLSTTYPFASK